MTKIMTIQEAQDLIENTIANEKIPESVKSALVETILRCVADEASLLKTYNEVHNCISQFERED